MHLVKIAAPPERVYEALTTTEGIINWWTRDADLEATAAGWGVYLSSLRQYLETGNGSPA